MASLQQEQPSWNTLIYSEGEADSSLHVSFQIYSLAGEEMPSSELLVGL